MLFVDIVVGSLLSMIDLGARATIRSYRNSSKLDRASSKTKAIIIQDLITK